MLQRYVRPILEINRIAYVVLPDRKNRLHFQKRKADGAIEATYVVHRQGDRLTCSCPAGKDDRECKHAAVIWKIREVFNTVAAGGDR